MTARTHISDVMPTSAQLRAAMLGRYDIERALQSSEDGRLPQLGDADVLLRATRSSAAPSTPDAAARQPNAGRPGTCGGVLPPTELSGSRQPRSAIDGGLAGTRCVCISSASLGQRCQGGRAFGESSAGAPHSLLVKMPACRPIARLGGVDCQRHGENSTRQSSRSVAAQPEGGGSDQLRSLGRGSSDLPLSRTAADSGGESPSR